MQDNMLAGALQAQCLALTAWLHPNSVQTLCIAAESINIVVLDEHNSMAFTHRSKDLSVCTIATMYDATVSTVH
jgi:hypothetical protein